MRPFKVLQLAMDPADAVRHARIPKEIAIASSLIDCLVECCKRGRHPAEVSARQTKEEKRRQKQETVAEFRCQASRFRFDCNRCFILGLEEMQTTTPSQTGRQCGLMIQCSCCTNDVIQNWLGFFQLAVAHMLERHQAHGLDTKLFAARSPGYIQGLSCSLGRFLQPVREKERHC